MEKSPLWTSDAPVLSDVQAIASDPSCQGILASSLWQALQKQPSDEEEDTGSDDNEVYSWNSPAKDRIMSALGQAVAVSTPTAPPAAVLKGKVVSYNRLGSKWRILAKDCRLRKRKPVLLTKKLSLWDAHDAHDRNSSSETDMEVSGVLEILAYSEQG